MHVFDFKRKVIVDGQEFFVEVRHSEPRHVDRFHTRCYAIVELPKRWQATVPVPDCVRVTSHLWYRELIKLVHVACGIVQQRASAPAVA